MARPADIVAEFQKELATSREMLCALNESLTAIEERIASLLTEDGILQNGNCINGGQSPSEQLPQGASQSEKPYLVWYSDPKTDEVRRKLCTRNELAKVFLTIKQTANIFIENGLLYATTQHEGQCTTNPINIGPRELRLLIILVIKKGKPVNSKQAYLKAFQRRRLLINETQSSIEQGDLKIAMSRLRRVLKEHDLQKKIIIPHKRWREGYRCLGDFTFCIIQNAASWHEFEVDTT